MSKKSFDSAVGSAILDSEISTVVLVPSGIKGDSLVLTEHPELSKSERVSTLGFFV